VTHPGRVDRAAKDLVEWPGSMPPGRRPPAGRFPSPELDRGTVELVWTGSLSI